MLPDDAFLRRLPRTLDRKQALLLEALVFASDSAGLAFRNIFNPAKSLGKKIISAPALVKTNMLSAAWTIVDQIHTMRQILHALDLGHADLDTILERYKVAQRLRNRMDHLANNAGNLATAKARMPLFGSLTYVCVLDEHMVTKPDGSRGASGAGIVLITAGRVTGGESMRLLNPAGRPMMVPVSNFQLEAFGETLLLDGALSDLQQMMVLTNKLIEDYFRDAATEAQAAHGLTEEQLFEHGAVGACIYMEVKFQDKPLADETPSDSSP